MWLLFAVLVLASPGAAESLSFFSNAHELSEYPLQENDDSFFLWPLPQENGTSLLLDQAPMCASSKRRGLVMLGSGSVAVLFGDESPPRHLSRLRSPGNELWEDAKSCVVDDEMTTAYFAIFISYRNVTVWKRSLVDEAAAPQVVGSFAYRAFFNEVHLALGTNSTLFVAVKPSSTGLITSIFRVPGVSDSADHIVNITAPVLPDRRSEGVWYEFVSLLEAGEGDPFIVVSLTNRTKPYTYKSWVGPALQWAGNTGVPNVEFQSRVWAAAAGKVYSVTEGLLVTAFPSYSVLRKVIAPNVCASWKNGRQWVIGVRFSGLSATPVGPLDAALPGAPVWLTNSIISEGNFSFATQIYFGAPESSPHPRYTVQTRNKITPGTSTTGTLSCFSGPVGAFVTRTHDFAGEFASVLSLNGTVLFSAKLEGVNIADSAYWSPDRGAIILLERGDWKEDRPTIIEIPAVQPAQKRLVCSVQYPAGELVLNGNTLMTWASTGDVLTGGGKTNITAYAFPSCTKLWSLSLRPVWSQESVAIALNDAAQHFYVLQCPGACGWWGGYQEMTLEEHAYDQTSVHAQRVLALGRIQAHGLFFDDVHNQVVVSTDRHLLRVDASHMRLSSTTRAPYFACSSCHFIARDGGEVGPPPVSWTSAPTFPLFSTSSAVTTTQPSSAGPSGSVVFWIVAAIGTCILGAILLSWFLWKKKQREKQTHTNHLASPYDETLEAEEDPFDIEETDHDLL